MIYQAIYSSAATAELSDTAIDDILAVAREHNAAAGITGTLVFAEGVFLQVLEGPKDAVTALLTKIATDPRHRDMTVFYEAEHDAPAFADWRMAYISPSSADMARWIGQPGTASPADLRTAIERRSDVLPHALAAMVEALTD
jgi:hypothetical protein